MPNSTNFYKELFLHVIIPVPIIVPEQASENQNKLKGNVVNFKTFERPSERCCRTQIQAKMQLISYFTKKFAYTVILGFEL